MRFMVPGHHTFEVTYKSCPDRAEVYMHKHEEGQEKADNYMNEVVYFKPACSQDFRDSEGPDSAAVFGKSGGERHRRANYPDH